MPETETELKPCPFCGGKPEFRRSGRQGHYIACNGCDSSSTLFTAAKDDVAELLIETWNRRPAVHPESVLLAEAVKVKPLEWLDNANDGWIAETSIGDYELTLCGYRDAEEWVLTNAVAEIGLYAVDRLDAAKAAAQADYEARILSALPAQPVEAQTQEKVLTADQLCRSPLIEWLVPTTEEWNSCEVMQDRYDLMKKRVRLAFTDAALATASEVEG